MASKLLGFQIHLDDWGIVEEFTELQVLPLTFCLRWIKGEHKKMQEDPERSVRTLSLVPVYEGEIESPKFPHGKSSLDLDI